MAGVTDDELQLKAGISPQNRRELIWGMKRVCLRFSSGIMEDHPDWPALLKEYTAALEHFERASAALTAALLDRDTSTDDLPSLFAAEASARDHVALSRMRIIALWRESQPNLDLSSILPNHNGKNA
jgi:hypothetical protein